jgi:hypothetical protein
LCAGSHPQNRRADQMLQILRLLLHLRQSITTLSAG